MNLPLAAVLALAPAAAQAPAASRDDLGCLHLVTDYLPEPTASGRLRYAPHFRIEPLGGAAWPVVREPPWVVYVDAREPALLVSQARAEGGVDLLLARCLRGAVELRSLGTLAYAMLLADWLDGPGARLRGGIDWSRATIRPGPGGQLLFLEGLGVLDTHAWRLLAADQPAGFHALASRRPFAAAPDGHRYACAGIDARGRMVIGVIALDGRPGEIVPVPKAARRAFDGHPAPADWFAEHFDWRAGPEGYRLQARR